MRSRGNHGTVSSTSVRTSVDACLEKIDRRDAELRAWVYVDREGARRSADSLDRDAAASGMQRPLFGLTVAVKDIFDVTGMDTTSGAPPFAHRRPERDAPAVAALRSAGAVILGKTVTTEFAFADPSVTRNPWNLAHTPGGSSSGSAAAVAAGMAQVALGSQTIGSTIRPAGYCGVVGFKATYGRISTEGVTPLSWSLDHVGIFARSVEDTARVYSILAGDHAAVSDSATEPFASPSPGGPLRRSNPPRFSVPRAWVDSAATPAVREHLVEIAELLRRAGGVVEEIMLPASGARIETDGRLVLRVEVAAYHSRWFSEHAAEYAPKIKELIESGLLIPAIDYIRAHEARYQFRREMGSIFSRYDALLLPSAPAPAPPLSENTTGDPVFCAPWSFAGLPSIALPSGITPGGLPLSVQLVGAATADAQLLDLARWCEARLGFNAAPPP